MNNNFKSSETPVTFLHICRVYLFPQKQRNFSSQKANIKTVSKSVWFNVEIASIYFWCEYFHIQVIQIKKIIVIINSLETCVKLMLIDKRITLTTTFG